MDIEIETLNAMNNGMYLSLMMIKVTLLILTLLAITGFVIYLAGVSLVLLRDGKVKLT
jgi:hypothetical protein